MLGWTVIAPTLLAVVTECAKDTSLPSTLFGAEWYEGAHGSINDEQRLAIRMRITTVIGIHEDDVTIDEDGLATVSGQRKFTIQILAITTERTDAILAMAALERIRTRLARPRIIDTLLAIDVSLIDIRQSIKATFKDGGRIMNAATMDVVFGGVVNDTDPVPMNWIEAVEYTSHIQDIDGTELPAPALNDTFLVPEDFVPASGGAPTSVYVDPSGHVVIGATSGAIYVGPTS